MTRRAALLVPLVLTLALVAGCNEKSAPKAAEPPGPVVRTDTGAVSGTVLKDRRVFQGIPYAAPPVGPLRWKPPAPAQPWTGVRPATKPGNRCPQTKNAIADLGSTTEDCLVLNVTTPRTAGPEQRKPVMVWIHGDGAIGSGDQFDPERLVVDGDVVVVTFNFRLGVFGGFGLPEMPGSGTIGLQDQRAALEWVQRNAAAFGGDPGNVTLFGVSYGATSTGAHLLAEKSRGLFHRAILQSAFTVMDMPAGSTYPGIPALPWYGWTTTKDAQTQGQVVANQLGCKDPATALDCLRKVPVAKLLAVPQVMNIFQPYALGNDELPPDPVRALEARQFADVPVIAGTTRDEHTTFVAFFRELAGSPVTKANYPELLRTAFGPAATRIAAQYPLSAYKTPALAWASVLTDRLWAKAQLRQNQLLSAKNPLWFYEFADRDAPLDIPFPPGFDPGAWHAGDVGYVFRTAGENKTMTKPQIALSEKIIGYWSAFAHHGDPNRDGLPSWPKFTGPATVQSLAPDAIAPVDYEREHQLKFWASVG
ncbi:carboxylesterase/lipase family protein [Kribbella italica]|uniref:Para-nitrobenzyl esterase n=1 Tax=Kribbella italica TaxID=1540520 RepID=A0A7W9J880_9ACTN|nr:carboxylesterase family protein [Kribbella italica]MBB5837431.1 para-nitrobenzyl esterase [Kribbella italica]